MFYLAVAMKRNLAQVDLFIVLVIHRLWSLVYKRYAKVLPVVFLFCNNGILHSQNMLPAKGEYSFDAGVSFRVLEQMPGELNLMFTHRDKYGFQLGVFPGVYTDGNFNGNRVNVSSYAHSLGMKQSDLALEFNVAAIALRPSFFLVKKDGKVSSINGVGVNYCYSKNTLTTRDLNTAAPKNVNDIVEYHHTLAMEFYTQIRYYPKGRFNLFATALMGMNAEHVIMFKDKVPFRESDPLFNTGQGLLWGDYIYVNVWVGMGYKLIE